MKRLNPFLILALVMIASIYSCKTGSSGEAVDLKFNLEEGHSYTTNIAVKSVTNAMGMDINMTMSMDVDMLIEDVAEDHSFTMSNTFTRVQFAQDMPGMGKVNYDSDSPDSSAGPMANVYQEAFTPLIGKKLGSTMDERGNVKSITGLEDLAAGDESAQLESLQNNLSGNMDYFFSPFPDKPVKVGDSWDRSMTITTQFPMEINAIYTLEDISDGTATLGVKGDFSFDPESDMAKQGGVSGLSGTQSGTLEIDLASGWTLKGELEQNMTINISQAGQSIDMDMTNTVSFSSN